MRKIILNYTTLYYTIRYYTKQKKQNKTKQNKTKQNKTKQNKTKQNKIILYDAVRVFKTLNMYIYHSNFFPLLCMDFFHICHLFLSLSLNFHIPVCLSIKYCLFVTKKISFSWLQFDYFSYNFSYSYLFIYWLLNFSYMH